MAKDNNYEQIRYLVDQQDFKNFQQVKVAFRDSNQIILNEVWLLEYHVKGNGWRVIPRTQDHHADGETSEKAYFCCVIKGCTYYTYGGVVCPQHKPWEVETVELLSDEEDEEGQHHKNGPDAVVSQSHLEGELSNGLLSSKVIREVLDDLFEERKDSFGPEESDEFKHLYSLHSVWKWKYHSQRHNVIVHKNNIHSRSFQFETTDGRFIFYSCGHIPFCRNLAIFSTKHKLVHHYCYEHNNEVMGAGAFSTRRSRFLKLKVFEEFSELVVRFRGLPELNDADDKWLELYKFLYERGETGQILHTNGYELIIKLTQEGQLKIDIPFSRGTSNLCIGGRFRCLRALRLKSEQPHHSFYCEKCFKLDSRFDFEAAIQDINFGQLADEFFKYI